MGLDYSKGCVNFRDVGEMLHLICDSTRLPVGRLLRGGKIDFVRDAMKIGSPATILNVRRGADPQHLPAEYIHFPISNDYEKYETATREVRGWLNDVVGFFANQDVSFPVLIHCTSGKDRTGVVVAALLFVLDFPREVIVEEYLLSDGGVQSEWIETALDGIGDVVKYFNRVDLDAVRQTLCCRDADLEQL